VVARDPTHARPLAFPPPWPGRPWIYANVIASADGIVTWARSGPGDDPVRAVAGGDFSRPGRLADRLLMRRLRAAADAVSFGAQTLRDHPDLIGAADDVGGAWAEALRRQRAADGRSPIPLHVIYSASGRVDLAAPMFNTPGLSAVVATTAAGAARLRAAGSEARGVGILVDGDDGDIDSGGLVRVHERLSGEFGVRYLDCEGGVVVLDTLRRAGLLDEIFVTATDARIDLAAHQGVKRVVPAQDGARLVGEDRLPSDAGYRFQRWRFNER